MIIDPKASQLLNLRKPETKTAAEKPAPGPAPETSATPPAGDRVVLSDRSKLIAKARELAAQAPDVRSEKVADLTARLAAGTYKVSSETVAASILKKSISELI
jgi:negative regulator of flagellin synthesis FlgM